MIHISRGERVADGYIMFLLGCSEVLVDFLFISSKQPSECRWKTISPGLSTKAYIPEPTEHSGP